LGLFWNTSCNDRFRNCIKKTPLQEVFFDPLPNVCTWKEKTSEEDPNVMPRRRKAGLPSVSGLLGAEHGSYLPDGDQEQKGGKAPRGKKVTKETR